MKNISRSLADIIGEDYCSAVCSVSSYLNTADAACTGLGYDKVEFAGSSFMEKQQDLGNKIGEKLFDSLADDNPGAPTDSFRKAFRQDMTPLGGLGCFRIGEDGRVYLAAKSEHYHTSVGHNFPGYKLVDKARMMGIPNATHNNTRGYITRLLERELIRTANGLERGDSEGLRKVLASKEKHVLNRVINLETGSLAVEAGMKMMLARFYRLDKTFDEPKYSGKIPVFFVIADNDGGFEANYHGTTIIAQTFRGMWPELYERFRDNDLYKIVGVKINDINDFEVKIKEFNTGKYKTAGFLHEIVLMNYGGIRLAEEYLRAAYGLCREYDTFVLCDEIQSCMWYEGMYLFRHYGLDPDFVILGKGFPGGEYPASRILTTYEADCLNQFGALVTNGQEELASLSYLITMEFAQENAVFIRETGEYIEKKLAALKDRHSDVITDIAGKGHLCAIHFRTVEETVAFVKAMNAMCIDISAHTYKANCPPAALLKPPIIITKDLVDIVILKMDSALS